MNNTAPPISRSARTIHVCSGHSLPADQLALATPPASDQCPSCLSPRRFIRRLDKHNHPFQSVMPTARSVNVSARALPRNQAQDQEAKRLPDKPPVAKAAARTTANDLKIVHWLIRILCDEYCLHSELTLTNIQACTDILCTN